MKISLFLPSDLRVCLAEKSDGRKWNGILFISVETL